MTYLSNCTTERLRIAFAQHDLFLEEKSNYFSVNGSNPDTCTAKKIEEIVKSAGFCPLISQRKIDGNFAFTVVPEKIPNIFYKKGFKASETIEVHNSSELATKNVNENHYFTKEELAGILKDQIFLDNTKEQVDDRWLPVNKYRTFVTAALSKGVSELVSNCKKRNLPIIEIGSGIGYSLEGLTNVIRTQPHSTECTLLSKTISEPIYQMKIEEIYNTLSSKGKKIPLFFAINVFDTLSSKLRKKSFLQLSQLQNPGDGILIMLDTNPSLDVMVKELESLYPDHAILPYFALSGEPEKYSVIAVPLNLIGRRGTLGEIVYIINQELENIRVGNVSEYRQRLHDLQYAHNLQVIKLEDYFAEKAKSELLEAGYEATIYYHNSFACGQLPKSIPKVNQDFVYKPVTCTYPVRLWAKDQKFSNNLAEKGLSIPEEFTEEFLISVRERGEKVLGAEFLVINAKKI